MFFAQKNTMLWIDINGPSYSVSCLEYLDSTLLLQATGFILRQISKRAGDRSQAFPVFNISGQMVASIQIPH